MLFERPFKALFHSLNIKKIYIDSKLKHILLLFFMSFSRVVVTPQKYPIIFIIIFFIYSRYELSQTWVFLEKIDKLTNCEM